MNENKLHFDLPVDDYIILCQKSKTAHIDNSKYIRHLLLECPFAECTISTHNINQLIRDLDHMTFKLSGYYDLMVREGKISEDLADTILKYYRELSDYCTGFLSDFFSYRESAIENENRRIGDVYERAVKSERRNMNTSVNITAGNERISVLVRVTDEEYGQIQNNLSVIKVLGFGRLIGYLTELLHSTRYIWYETRDDDVEKMMTFFTRATKPCSGFVNQFIHQGDNSRAEQLALYRKNIIETEKAVMTAVINDRQDTYMEFMQKSRLFIKERSGQERRRRFKEPGNHSGKGE